MPANLSMRLEFEGGASWSEPYPLGALAPQRFLQFLIERGRSCRLRFLVLIEIQSANAGNFRGESQM